MQGGAFTPGTPQQRAMVFPGPGRMRLQPLILMTDCPGCALVSSLSLTFGEEFQKGSFLLSNLSVSLVSTSETG